MTTRKINKRFEIAACAALGNRSEMNDGALAILQVAVEADRLARSLERAAREMAERFARYADEVAEARDASTPMGYGTLRDMDADAATYKAAKIELSRLVRLLLGGPGHDLYSASLAASVGGEGYDECIRCGGRFNATPKDKTPICPKCK